MNKKIIFLVGIALIIGVGLTTALSQERILKEGVTVVLETRPVDPRDLFRGEYVILRYQIEEDTLVKSTATLLSEGSDIYIQLFEDQDGIARVRNVSRTEPVDMSGAWIQGEVTGFGEVRFSSLEQYYVPEGAGRPIEDLRNELHVRVAINKGDARVVELLDGNLDPIDPFEYRERMPVEGRELEARPEAAPLPEREQISTPTE